MAEYIEREALIACIEERQDEYSDIELSFNDMSRGEWNGLELAKERISSAPAADVAPVAHGRWLKTEEPLGGHEIDCVECSACHESWVVDEDYGYDFLDFWHYCPNCGANMKDGE